MPTLILDTASTLPPTRATTATMIVTGCLSAKMIGFIKVLRRVSAAVSRLLVLFIRRRRDGASHRGGLGHGMHLQVLGGLAQGAVESELGAAVVGHGAVGIGVGLGQRLHRPDDFL